MVWFLILSALSHALIFSLVAIQQPAPSRSPPKALRVDLVATAQMNEMVETPVSDTSPEQDMPTNKDISQTENLSGNLNEDQSQALVKKNPPTATPEQRPASDGNGATLITTLKAQLSDVISELNPIEAPSGEARYTGKALPKLPGAPSLFDGWMGPVKPTLDQWSDAGGARNARLTLANGDLVCIKQRAPTTQELFNPWMSVAIPMTRLCGRKTPQTPDLTDPWLRARPNKKRRQ